MCGVWSFSSTGIYLTFKVTGDVPVTHVAANTDSTVPFPAVVTISCNQCFSVNKWITSGKGLALSVAHDAMSCNMSIATLPRSYAGSMTTPLPELYQVAMTIGRILSLLLGGEASWVRLGARIRSIQSPECNSEKPQQKWFDVIERDSTNLRSLTVILESNWQQHGRNEWW